MDGSKPRGEDRAQCFPDDPEAVEFIPQVYGVPGRGRRAKETAKEPVVPKEYNTILGWNEPNLHDQADIPPKEAAVAWRKFQKKYHDRVLVAPSTAGTNATGWFDAFMEACKGLGGCRFDYLATHHYKVESAEKTMKTLKDYSDRYDKKPIWLTEFAVWKTHDEDKIINYIKDLLPQLENADFIYRYSWFVSRYDEDKDLGKVFWVSPVNSLLEQNSSRLSRVGKAYNKPWHLPKYKPAKMYY